MTRTHVMLCQRRFVPLILAGTKACTIRGERKRAIRAGDLLDLRAWRGAPYRSKQKKLRVVIVLDVLPITITTGEKMERLEVTVSGRRLTPFEIAYLSIRDGFAHFVHFAQFFHETHGPVFRGQLIKWSP